jgi:DHA3 family tetracycline resistance protein-like MFS transporter
MLRPLKARDFALLWGGLTVSMLGDGIYLVALPFLVLHILNEPSALSAVGLAWTLPMVLLLVAGGIVTDRADRRRVLIVSDLIRGGAVAAVGVLAVTAALELWHLLALVAVYGAGEAFFGPAYGAIVPDVVPRNLLTEANALNQFSRPLTFRLAGPGLGGLIVARFGPGVAMLIDAATFVLSAAAVAAMQRRQRAPGAGSSPSALAEIAEGWRFVRGRPWLWATLAAAAFGLLAYYGPFEVLVPYRVRNVLGGDAGDFGLIVALGGVGSLLGSAVMGQRGLPRHHITVTYLAWGTGTLAVAGFALSDELWAAMALSFYMGACFTIGQIIWGTLMHVYVPSHILGRVSALDWTVSIAFVPLSFALTGPAAESFGVDPTLTIAGFFGFAALLAFLFVPGVRALEHQPASA